MNAGSILQLVHQYGHAKTSEDAFALLDAIRNALEMAQHENEMLMPKICCQEFATCKEVDCVVRLNWKIKTLEEAIGLAPESSRERAETDADRAAVQ